MLPLGLLSRSHSAPFSSWQPRRSGRRLRRLAEQAPDEGQESGEPERDPGYDEEPCGVERVVVSAGEPCDPDGGEGEPEGEVADADALDHGLSSRTWLRAP